MVLSFRTATLRNSRKKASHDKIDGLELQEQPQTLKKTRGDCLAVDLWSEGPYSRTTANRLVLSDIAKTVNLMNKAIDFVHASKLILDAGYYTVIHLRSAS